MNESVTLPNPGDQPLTQPFFTIGVPTYNRHDLLRETLNSILAQSFTDFEIIVGNDYTDELLSGEMLGINDPRIRIVNHPVNLREVGNMNALLYMASGRYFTWLFDDDLYEPGYLSTAHTTLSSTGFPPALFTSYNVIDDNGQTLDTASATGAVTLFSGADFLLSYFSGRLILNSTCGMFDTKALIGNVGGVEELCESAIGLYCEYLFLVRCGLFGQIVHIDTPFVTFRAHSGSWGESNTELWKYHEAGQNLILRSAQLVSQNVRNDIFSAIIIGLCRIHLLNFATKSVISEICCDQTDIGAAYRAVSRFNKEAAAIRSVLDSIGATGWNFQFSVSFLKIRIYCYRFILGKLRLHRRRKKS